MTALPRAFVVLVGAAAAVVQPRFVGDAVGPSMSVTFLGLAFWTGCGACSGRSSRCR